MNTSAKCHWSDVETARLRRLRAAGKPVEECARVLGRTVKSVRCRLAHLQRQTDPAPTVKATAHARARRVLDRFIQHHPSPTLDPQP
jgi:hypothetical protein